MSRQFDTTAGTDSITFSVGGAAPDQGPITVGVLAKASSVAGFTGWMVAGRKSGTAVWGFLTSNNAGPKLFAENDFGNGVSGLSTSWRWYVLTKASGNVAPRIHVWDLSGTWSHTDNSAGVLDGTGPIDTLIVGSQNGSSSGWRGSIAAVATFASQLNDAAVEATFTLSAATLLAATPGWMIRLNQASTATSITDDTGGGGDQSAITGTSVDADDPPGFSYALTNNVDGAVAQTVTASGTVDAAVDRPTSAAQTLSLAGTVAGTVLLGQTVAQAVALAGTVDGQVIHNALVAQTISVAGTVTPEPAAVAARVGNWMSLMSITQGNAADAEWWRTRIVTTCPIHEYPLDSAPDRPDVLHCDFGEEFYDLHGKQVWI